MSEAQWVPTRPVPAPEVVQAGRTAAGGYTRETLGRWGVPWPPPPGWREQLATAWAEEQGPPEPDPFQLALAAQAAAVLSDRPGISLVPLARLLGVRMTLCWTAVATGLESGEISVRNGGLWANHGPARRRAQDARLAEVLDGDHAAPLPADADPERFVPEGLIR